MPRKKDIEPTSTTGGDESVLVPVAIGELVDKITILEIKAERITEPAKLRNIHRELAQLLAVRDRQGAPSPAKSRSGYPDQGTQENQRGAVGDRE